jgi:branched-chain amino acid transport system ATP-binding protein
MLTPEVKWVGDMPLLKLENIIVHYGSIEAVKGVFIKLEEGDLIGLVGANGAGKSTILRTISGLEKPTSGQILLRGERIEGVPPENVVMKGISHVPEGRRVFPYMTVYENLRMGGYIQKDKAQFEDSLYEVYELFPGLKKKSRQAAGTLSGGEQQMLAIGRALMNNPKILLMDEPTIGLAPLMVEMLVEGIVKLRHRGLSIILVEQNVRVALDIVTWCHVMELGRIVLEGPTKDIIGDERIKEAYLGG